ncbi:unnamed protein product [Closterium sp. Yama58-4]|nr:unnamed protein product [Closterium sp. Yama58-4]
MDMDCPGVAAEFGRVQEPAADDDEDNRNRNEDDEDGEETGDDFELHDGPINNDGGGISAGGPGWEAFLPQGSLRVLLVEDDDSTRHVVGALLRNCSYEVTPASNGVHAWELLTASGAARFDLVLTDVVMPGLSGIGLLTRIMTREALRGMPVIMMSSHDSMEMVLKCFQKGAADFLVKPVRKNELKNLWQHVWRRCHSSTGSGSGSGSGTNGKVLREKRGAYEGDGVGCSFNVNGGSDNGSGTQVRIGPRAAAGIDAGSDAGGDAGSYHGRHTEGNAGRDAGSRTCSPVRGSIGHMSLCPTDVSSCSLGHRLPRTDPLGRRPRGPETGVPSRPDPGWASGSVSGSALGSASGSESGSDSSLNEASGSGDGGKKRGGSSSAHLSAPRSPAPPPLRAPQPPATPLLTLLAE